MNKSAGSAWVAAVETLKTYHGDWRAIAAREWRKFRGLVDPFEVPNNLSYRYAAEVSPVLRGLLTYGILLPVALAGMVLVGLADWRRHLLPLLFLGAATGWLMLSMMVGRFRLTLMPGLAVYAAAGLVFAWDALRAGRWWRAGLWAALLAAAALLQHAVMPLPDVRRNPHQMTYWMEYVSANRFYISQGDYGRAIDEARRLQAAAEGRPGLEGAFYKGCAMELRTRLELARRLLAAGRAQEARSQVRQAHEAGRLIPAYTTIDREFERQFTACGDTEAAEACRQRLKAEEGAAAPPHDDKTP